MFISLITIASLIVGLIIQLSMVISLPTNHNLTESILINHEKVPTVFESVNYKLLSSSSQPNQSLINTINSKLKSKMNNLNESSLLSLINYDPISLIKLTYHSLLESPVNNNQTIESIVTVDPIRDDVNYTNIIDDDDDDDEDDESILFTDEVDDNVDDDIDDDGDNNQDDNLSVDDDYYTNDLITIENSSLIEKKVSDHQLIKRLPINQQDLETIKSIMIKDDNLINGSVDQSEMISKFDNQINLLTKLPLERFDSRSPKSLRDRANSHANSPATGLRSHRNGTRFRDGCSTLRSSEYPRP